MANGKNREVKQDKHKKKQHKKKNPAMAALKPTKTQKPFKKLKTKKENEIGIGIKKIAKVKLNDVVQEGPTAKASIQLSYFLQQYQSNGVQLSSLELDSLTESCMLEFCENPAQKTSDLGEYIKVAYGESWRESLLLKPVEEGKIEPGNPSLLVISASAIRALELLRELRPLTGECKAAKLFSKHMKIDEQVAFLKNHVNVASGTPSRIKKLIDIEALGLSRVTVIVLDLHADVKGYNLLTLPQVRDEFWDLYRSYFHQRLLDGNLRICLYGLTPYIEKSTEKVNADD